MAEPGERRSDTSVPVAEALYGLTTSLVRAVAEALESGDARRAARLVEPLHEADQADLIERLSPDGRRQLVAALHDRFNPEVLPHLDEAVREEVIAELGTEDLAAAISGLDTDDAVSLIEDLDASQQRQVLEAIPAPERVALEEGLTFPEQSAGRLMQREVVTVPVFWTIGQTIDYMRERDDLPDTFYEIFVVNPRHEPVGTVPLARLLRSKRPVLVRDIMDKEIKTIPAETDQEEVAYLFDQYGLVSAPVVSPTGRLIGVITVDDVVDVIREEADEDIMRLGGVVEGDLYRDVLRTTRGRFTWLVVNLFTAVLASLVIYQFSVTISQMVALAVLMPIVASMGGNAGTQTMTVAVRALATKELTLTNALRILGKEVLVGGVNGILFALIVGAIASLWYENYALGLVIGAAMIVNMLVAGLFGMVIPLALWRLHWDPAAGAGVLLTTVTDVVGFFAFLGLASWLLL